MRSILICSSHDDVMRRILGVCTHNQCYTCPYADIFHLARDLSNGARAKLNHSGNKLRDLIRSVEWYIKDIALNVSDSC